MFGVVRSALPRAALLPALAPCSAHVASIFPAPRPRALAHQPRRDSSILIGGLTIAAGAMAARYALQAYDKSQGGGSGGSDAGSQSAEGDSSSSSGGSGSGSGGSGGSDAAGGSDGASAGDKASGGGGAEAPGAQQPSQKSWGAELLAKRFYRGGFEDKMTRREAALILGVRESATPERVRDRHRKMLMLNHPDMGASKLHCAVSFGGARLSHAYLFPLFIFTQAEAPSWLRR